MTPSVPVQEVKPLIEQVVEALPTIPEATTVTVSSVIGVSAGLATPFLLKLIKPAVKKAAKKLQKAFWAASQFQKELVLDVRCRGR